MRLGAESVVAAIIGGFRQRTKGAALYEFVGRLPLQLLWFICGEFGGCCRNFSQQVRKQEFAQASKMRND